jgi:YD repeat-containing protein
MKTHPIPLALSPTMTFSNYSTSLPVTVSDALGRVTTVTPTTRRRPSSTTNNFTATVNAGKQVTQVNADGIITTYNYADAAGVRTVTVSRASLPSRVLTFNIASGLLLTDRNEAGQTTTYSYNSLNQLIEVTAPEGNKVIYARDTRGNVTSSTARAKPGSGLADIVTSAAYPPTCTNVVTCNKPTSTTDAKGNVTDYAYDAVTGRVTSVTAPAPAPGAVRPQTRLGYSAINGVTVLATTSQCITAASCAGTADEVKTSIAYGANLQPASVTTGAGDGTVTSTTSVTYDLAGNVTSVDGPLPGTADTSRAFYDAARQPVKIVGPDPDGGGPLKNRALTYAYNPDGQVTSTAAGTANADGTNFVGLQQSNIVYDAAGRPVQSTNVAGGTTYSLAQFSYDSAGRADCTAVRTDPAQWGAQTNACLPQTTGANGPDQISRTIYNPAGQVAAVQSAVGTADQTDEVSYSYTANGNVATLADGKGNLTSSIYDGFDRVSETRLPGAANGSVSSASDYESYSYDAGGNVTQRRLRDGQIIIGTYDALNRQTYKQVWKSGTGIYETTATVYDNLGRPTTINDAANNFVGIDSALQPFVTLSFTRLPWDCPQKTVRVVCVKFCKLAVMVLVMRLGAVRFFCALAGRPC